MEAITTPFSILLLALLSLVSGGGNDLASYLDPADYFNSRRLESTTKGLLEMAGKTPETPQEGLTRLLAVRALAAQRDRLGDQKPAVRAILQKLADTKDEDARNHARQALALFDGKRFTPDAAPADSARRLAFEAFPAGVGMAGGVDLRPAAGEEVTEEQAKLGDRIQSLRARGYKKLPRPALDAVYDFADATGNVCVDRLAGAFDYVPGRDRESRIFVRFTGRASTKGLAQFIARTTMDTKVEEKKGAQGEPLTLLTHSGPPAFALIADREMYMAGYQGNLPNNLALVEEMLAAPKQGGFLKGDLAKQLAGVPAVARAAGVMRLPEDLRAEMARTPLGTAPTTAVAWLVIKRGAMELNVGGTMADEAEAKKFAEALQQQLKNAAPATALLPPPFSNEAKEAIKKTLEGAEVKSDGVNVRLRITVSLESQMAMVGLVGSLLDGIP